MSDYFREIEEGEIHSEDDLSVLKKSNVDLEDLSSCEELFRSDSTPSYLLEKKKRYTRVSGRASRATSRRNKNAQPTLSPGSKRNVVRKQSPATPSRACAMPAVKEVKKKSRPRKRQSQRELRKSISPETGRCAKRMLTRGRSAKTVESAKKVVHKANDEASESTCSCPEKAAPKSSLKRRLMNMLTFPTLTVNEENNQALEYSVSSASNQKTVQKVDQEPILPNVKSEQSEPVMGKSRKRSISKVQKDLCHTETRKRKKETVTVEVKVEQPGTLEQNMAMLSPIAPKIEGTLEIESEKLTNISITGDDDLAELRKLALESSVMVASKKTVSGEAHLLAPATAEEIDDLTELRLQALRSAMLKKHMARKAKAAAAAATAATAPAPPPTLPPAHVPQPPAVTCVSIGQHQAHPASAAPPLNFPPGHVPQSPSVASVSTGQHQAHVATAASPPTFLLANIPHPPTATLVSVEQKQPHAASWNVNGYQCAANCDKTTLIVDMDLENTSDEDSVDPVSEDFMQLCKDSDSSYYTPESWIPFSENSVEPQNVEPLNFHGSNYQRDLLIPLTTTMDIPSFAQSMYDTRQESDMLPIIAPAQMFHQQVSPTLKPVPSIRLNKYSERPNLIQLPVAPNHSVQQHSVNLAHKKMTESFPCSDASMSSYTNSLNISRASSLIQIDLQTDSPKDVPIPDDRSEVTMNTHSPKRKDVPALIQEPSPHEFDDCSDTENMDISSMIVVDEVVCTSPEPEISIDCNEGSAVPLDTSNILTDLPVPSSQYTNRSMLPNTSPSTMRTVQMIKPPATIEKQKYPPGNPFILNNLRKAFQAKIRENSTLSTKRRVPHAQDTNLNSVVSNQPNLDVAKLKQMSFVSVRDSTIHSPTTNTGLPGRFVINLGDDSDSDDEVQMIENPKFLKFPASTVINERGLQQDTRVNQSTLIFPEDDPHLSAHLDAFLKDARAKHDRKTALLKKNSSKEALCSTSSSSVVTVSAPYLRGSGDCTSKVPRREQSTGEILPNTCNVFSVSTALPKTKLPDKKPERIHITSSASRPNVHSGQNLEQKREAVKFPNSNQPVLRNSKVTVDKGKRLVHGTSLKLSTPLASNRLQLTRTVTSSVINSVPSEEEPTLPKIILPPNVGSMKIPDSSAAQPKSSAGGIKNPNTRVTIATFEKKAAATVGSSPMKTHRSSDAQPIKVIKKPKTRITMDNTSTTCAITYKTKSVPSQPTTGVDLNPKKMTKPRMCGPDAAVLKPQALALCTRKTPKLDKPSEALPMSNSELVSAGMTQSFEPKVIPFNTSNEKPAENVIHVLETCKPLKPLVSQLFNSKPHMLVKPPLTSPVLKSKSHDSQVNNNQNAVIIPHEKAKTETNNDKNTSGKMDEVTLEKTEEQLLKERTSLLVDLTVILGQLNENNKVEHAINEMQVTILQQEKIIELAKQSIKLTEERMACETKKRAHTFNVIHNKWKSVTHNRDLCLKLRDQCVNLGSKMKGESYVAPLPLEAELRMRLEDVAGGISKTMKFVSPRKKITLPSISSSDDAEGSDICSIAMSLLNATPNDDSEIDLLADQEPATTQNPDDEPDDRNLNAEFSQ